VRVKGACDGLCLPEVGVEFECFALAETCPSGFQETTGYNWWFCLNPTRTADKEALPFTDHNLALIYAENDLRKNWEKYREEFLKEVLAS
jgi:hypothetical protein